MSVVSLCKKTASLFALALHDRPRFNGFVEGRNVAIEYRRSEGDESVLPAMAENLVRRNVAVITTVGGAQATLAAKAATPSIPIAFLVAVDPVALGIVASLNHPGGNLTGVPMRDIGGPNRVMANMEYRRCADWPQSP